MSNERKTETIVRKLLHENGYCNNQNIIIEEQKSDNPKIDKLLKNASKKGNGRGYPEFIITFIDKPDNIIVIECKASPSKHESEIKDKYSEYAVDGALLYASYLKTGFNVIAIGISGENEREIKISHYLWLKSKSHYKDIPDSSFLNRKSLFSIIEKQSAPIKEEELIKKAIEYNELLHYYSVPEGERCTLISCILVALQDNVFAESYKKYHSPDSSDKYNPNEALIEALLTSCRNVFKKNSITGSKSETILNEYSKIKGIVNFTSKNVTTKEEKGKKKNTILRDMIDDISINVMPYVNVDNFDVLGQFYTQFIRYAGSDKKTGLVLTPPHITDLFCELANLNINDIVFDPCCGTGGFLVSAMKYMINQSGNNQKIHKKIKTNQLIGIEIRPDMFTHACSNMMMRGDGKSHIHYGDCFNENLREEVSKEKPSKVFLNPPYDKGPDVQLAFVDNAMDCMINNGICIAVCQMSAAISSNSSVVRMRQRLLEKHTLEAVLSMPKDLFYPVGVNTCIIILKSGTPHKCNKKTFFGYYKEDGFIKAKNKGRIDQFGKWNNIKKRWLDAYTNRESVTGLSIARKVTAVEEWCAEAYMKTDYSTITQEDFIDVMKQYTIFKLIGNNPYQSDSHCVKN